ncbi:hypothetical protein FQN54_006206 [Arachnomyces sp. PD_36]|nr:hypothetical protein FQN54_006206 [Arachnomyces sp. PD_36]
MSQGPWPAQSVWLSPDFSCTGPDGVVIPPVPDPDNPAQPVPTMETKSSTTTEETGDGTVSNPDPTGSDPLFSTSTRDIPTSPTTSVTGGQTVSLPPPLNTAPEQAPPTSVPEETQIETLSHPSQTTTTVKSSSNVPPSSPEATSPGSGHPLTPVVIIDKTKTLTLPEVTQKTTVTTEGQVITLLPDGPSTITVASGKPPPTATLDATSTSSVVAISGTESFTFPPVTRETTVTTEGHTITLLPDGPATTTIHSGQQSFSGTKTGETASETSVVVVAGTQNFTFAPVTQGTTVTTDGQTITLLPGGAPTVTVNPGQQPQPPAPTPDTTTGAPVVAIIGTKSFTYPSVSRASTVTTEGYTFTLMPEGKPTVTVAPPPAQYPSPTGTPDETGEDENDGDQTGADETAIETGASETTAAETNDGDSDDVLPTYTEWPPEAVITPVETKVEKPEPSNDDDDDDSAIVPCKLWFFSICIEFDSINLLGWKFNLPPGIYPPGPPSLRNIKFPPSISIEGDLPPWPKFTVGPDHVPTFPSEPEPTNCETKTASLCSTTTSYAVSTIDGAEQTISSQVLPPTCGELIGCHVTDSSEEATVTATDECATATVTDVMITCSGSGTTDCSTKSKAPRTGCSATATTTTATCTHAPVEEGNSRRQADDNACPVAQINIVWPRDGTRKAETTAIRTALEELLQDESKIRASESTTLGIIFWRVTLDPTQAEKVRDMPNVAAVHRECTTDCADPSTGTATNWRYQVDYVEDVIENANGIDQMVYLSHKPNDMTIDYDKTYNFDVSAGEGVEVYIVDTGAQLDHAEFAEGDNVASKARFMFVGKDYDGEEHEDDSGVPLGGHCVNGLQCNPHGTGMLGAVAGAKLGVAKKVTPVLVRVPRRKKLGSGASPENYLEGVAMVDNSIQSGTTDTQAILSLSWYFDNELYFGRVDRDHKSFGLFRQALYQLLTSLIRKGLFVVTGSGNRGVAAGWPALYGAHPATVEPEKQDGWLHIPELLVVGSEDLAYGGKSMKSGYSPDKGLPHVYAPGEGILCAQGDKARWVDNNPASYKSMFGTSYSAAHTAGLAAYFLRLHQLGRLGKDAKGNDPDMSPAGLRQYILNNAWSRTTDRDAGDIMGIWNGADPGHLKLQGICPYNPQDATGDLKVRRQDDGVDALTGQCVPGTSPTGSPTTDVTALPPEATTDWTTLKTTTKEPQPTDFVCTEETADRCAPTLVCSAPRRNGCVDGKCVCLLPDPTTVPNPTTTQTTTEDPGPTSEPEATAAPETSKTPLEIGSQNCNDPEDFPDHKDVNAKDVMFDTPAVCTSDLMGPGDKVEQNMSGTWAQSETHYSVKWIEGCVTDVDEQSMDDPLGNDGGDWGESNNGGVGGWIDAGCLRYYMGAGHI